MINAFNGAHILVTRPEHQAENLCWLIERHGGIAIRFPTIKIVGIDVVSDNLSAGSQHPTHPLTRLSDYHWLIFTSVNAVNFALQAIGGKIAQFTAARRAAIGQATAKQLESCGLTADLTPVSGFDSEALLAMPELQNVRGKQILIVRGQDGREELAATLKQRGAQVEYWEVYRRIMPDIDCSDMKRLLDDNKINAILITSTESLQNLVVMLGEADKCRLVKLPLIVVSDRILRFAEGLGFKRISTADGPSDEAMLNKAIAVLNGELSV